jgi:excisionase family DNA binding protein
MPSPPLLTVQQVAELLSVPAERVYRMVRGGELAAIRLGPASIRFDPEDLERWIAEHRQEARDAS